MKKVIVFDMDETIGAFSALSRDMNELTYVLSYELFRNMMRPEGVYLRPNILNVLSMVDFVRRMFPNDTLIVLYTNNPNAEWIQFVVGYLHQRLGVTRFFDHIVHGSHPKRQPSLEKSIDDLAACTGVKGMKKMTFFFVDDQYHEKMNVPQVMYFLISPYREVDPFDAEPTFLLQRALTQFLNQ